MGTEEVDTTNVALFLFYFIFFLMDQKNGSSQRNMQGQGEVTFLTVVIKVYFMLMG